MQTKLLTLDELYSHDGAFLVEYNPNSLSRSPMWAFLMFITNKAVHLQFPAGSEQYSRTQYGITWRCWAARPTEDEMQAAPWGTMKRSEDQ